MKTEQLEAFLLVAECGSLTLAAQELGLTQPGLSRPMQRLERELGVPLFIRTQAGVRLTPAGYRFCAYAREALAHQRRLLAELHAADSAVAGALRIAASSTPAEFLVPRMVAEFTDRHPEVQATIVSTDSEEVTEEVLEGRAEIGFVGARIERNGLQFEPIAEDEIVLVVPRHHAFAGQRDVALAALAGQRFVEREGGSGTLLVIQRALAERGLALPAYRASMTVTTTRAVISAVRAGYGLGFVSSLALADETDGRIVAIRLAGIPLIRQLFLIRNGGRIVQPVARHFAEFVLRLVAPGGVDLAQQGKA